VTGFDRVRCSEYTTPNVVTRPPARPIVPFLDLAAQYASLRPEIDAAIQAVLESHAFVLGPELAAFERDFAAFVGSRHTIGVSSGTDALELVLRAYGIGPGDEVLTVANTYIATCEAVSATGATIRWVDADARTYNMDPSLIEAKITPRTRAVIPVHLYGQAAALDPIVEVARAHRLRVIEDCAQSVGARWRERMTGTVGDAGCFSFFPGKNLGAYGDGGAVVTDDDELADRLRLLRHHGMRQKYVHEVEGFCRRLDNLQAAVLGVKLPRLATWNAGRQRIAARYDALLAGLPALVTPAVAPGAEHVYHLYVVQVPRRDQIQLALRDRGVETGIHYPIPLHLQPAYADRNHRPEDYPVSATCAPRLLSLPIYPEMTDEQVEYVVISLRAALLEA
jgi:dTDP-4-amino-4,6-dideoxygalactose transaminase